MKLVLSGHYRSSRTEAELRRERDWHVKALGMVVFCVDRFRQHTGYMYAETRE